MVCDHRPHAKIASGIVLSLHVKDCITVIASFLQIITSSIITDHTSAIKKPKSFLLHSDVLISGVVCAKILKMVVTEYDSILRLRKFEVFFSSSRPTHAFNVLLAYSLVGFPSHIKAFFLFMAT
ncbi:unnamed protein product [Albugo candida]|uniref:Uncharacterized protein n=1 Tax=Albugo candida TaxID=65357 RepID=A0A024GFW5_9STRA|nr:unnamed protein product [Albugo candida]|eukprot:CCI45240.1 unnamed protein product [Albugo candida]